MSYLGRAGLAGFQYVRVQNPQNRLICGTAGDSRRGCLVDNTTAELVPGDPQAEALVAAAFDDFITVVAAALRRGQASGEIRTAAAPEVQAQLLLLLFQGSALVARARPDDGRLTRSIDLPLDALRQPGVPAVEGHRPVPT
jgi:TetR/AcrR family transcriptional repressor of nem operon